MQRHSHDFSHLLLLEGVLLVEQWVGEHLQQSLVLRENTTNTNKYNKYKQIQQKNRRRGTFAEEPCDARNQQILGFHFEGFLTNIDQITNI